MEFHQPLPKTSDDYLYQCDTLKHNGQYKLHGAIFLIAWKKFNKDIWSCNGGQGLNWFSDLNGH